MELSYQESAAEYIKNYYDVNAENSILFTYRFISQLVREAKLIAGSVGLQGMVYQDAIVTTWFRFAGICDIGTVQTESMKELVDKYLVQKLFHDFSFQTHCVLDQ